MWQWQKIQYRSGCWHLCHYVKYTYPAVTVIGKSADVNVIACSVLTRSDSDRKKYRCKCHCMQHSHPAVTVTGNDTDVNVIACSILTPQWQWPETVLMALHAAFSPRSDSGRKRYRCECHCMQHTQPAVTVTRNGTDDIACSILNPQRQWPVTVPMTLHVAYSTRSDSTDGIACSILTRSDSDRKWYRWHCMQHTHPAVTMTGNTVPRWMATLVSL